MAKVDLKIKSTTPTAQSQTTTISYVNPALTNEQLSTLGHTLNALTDNHYDESQKVTTVNVDSEPDTGKTTPTFYLARSSDSLTPVTTIEKNTTDWLIYNGDATAPGVITSNLGLGFGISNFENGHTRTIYAIHSTDFADGQYPITFFVPETNNYKSATYEAVYTKS